MFKKISLFLLGLFSVVSAQAVTIDTVVSKENISAYFVESNTLPMVSMQVSFRAGSAFDPAEKQGVSAMVGALIGQGTTKLTSEELQQKFQNIGAKFGASSGDLNVKVTLKTLSEHKEEAFELMKKALLHPRFDEEDFNRIKKAVVSNLKQHAEKPSFVLSENFNRIYYGKHPYGNSMTIESVEKLTLDDIRAFYAKHFNQANMVVSVVGDLSQPELVDVLDNMLADLPKGHVRNKIKQIPVVPTAQFVRIPHPSPQTHIMMAHKGISRHDPDYFAAYTMNYILGGGGFNSRLMEEVREKRGLAYSVYSYFEPMPIFGRFVAAVQTKNKSAGLAMDIMRQEFHKMKKGEITRKDVENAKRYLVGSFPLRIDSNAKILGYLTVMQMENLPVDYIDTWASKVNALTYEDIVRVAKRLLNPEEMVVVTVGGSN